MATIYLMEFFASQTVYLAVDSGEMAGRRQNAHTFLVDCVDCFDLLFPTSYIATDQVAQGRGVRDLLVSASSANGPITLHVRNSVSRLNFFSLLLCKSTKTNDPVTSPLDDGNNNGQWLLAHCMRSIYPSFQFLCWLHLVLLFHIPFFSF